MKRLALGLAMAMALWGCSSDDSNSGDNGDAAADVTTGDPCSYFTTSGDVCPLPTGKACFPECTSGGCTCTRKPDGQLRWSCVTDTSCFPDAGPLDDAGAPDDVNAPGDASDGSAPDASDDARADAAAGDAG